MPSFGGPRRPSIFGKGPFPPGPYWWISSRNGGIGAMTSLLMGIGISGFGVWLLVKTFSAFGDSLAHAIVVVSFVALGLWACVMGFVRFRWESHNPIDTFGMTDEQIAAVEAELRQRRRKR